ncbi:single-stranded DNA-binding protein [Micrococcus lylae]|uniref:single-stranded DNA-binding protein n=1 Tax=Micrococcus lylae TaxID=1273 RepID=UPI003EB6B2D4
MQDTITLRGRIATDPAERTTPNGVTVVNFRMATTERRFDRAAGHWADAHTNWYNVAVFGRQATNVLQSTKKGNPLVVVGRQRIRDWSTEERSGTSVDIVADAVGLDLNFGTCAYNKTVSAHQADQDFHARTGQPGEPQEVDEADVPEGHRVDPDTGELARVGESLADPWSAEVPGAAGGEEAEEEFEEAAAEASERTPSWA